MTCSTSQHNISQNISIVCVLTLSFLFIRVIWLGLTWYLWISAYCVMPFFSLKAEYPEIRYYVVLAYMPNGRNHDENHDYTETIYPEGLESVPKRFAIMYRNRWMINNANAVICHISHSWGGACQAVSLAERKKLKIVNLA